MSQRTWLGNNFTVSYNLSRNYPFKSFRWIALLSTIILLAIFSVFNVATNGYSLQSIVSLDPNATESQRQWFNNGVFTWGDNKLNPKCQNIAVGIGSQFMTTNQGSVHTITGISGPCSGDGKIRQCPSISYHAQVLDDCAVDSVEISLVKTDDSIPGPGTFWWSYASSSAKTLVHCNISEPSGIYKVSFDSYYPGATKSFSNFLAVEDYNTSASLWWGSRLMDNYLTGLKALAAQGGIHTNDAVEVHNGQLIFTTNNTASAKGFSLFNTDFFFYEKTGGIINPSNVAAKSQQQYYNNKTFWLSPILTEGIFFAKMFYSFVLTDLGQSGLANLLVDEQSLRYALSPDDDMNRQRNGTLDLETKFDWWRWKAISPPGRAPSAQNSVVMRDALATFPQSRLATYPTKIYSQYVCSVPQRKGISAVILIVLINNLVLISAAWTILRFMASTYTTAMDPTAMYCEGCISRKDDNVALLPLESPQPNFIPRKPLPDKSSGAYQSLNDSDDAIR